MNFSTIINDGGTFITQVPATKTFCCWHHYRVGLLGMYFTALSIGRGTMAKPKTYPLSQVFYSFINQPFQDHSKL